MKKTTKPVQLFFLQDLSFGSPKQVYSGHSGKGKKFSMNQSDYGKYAMQPRSKEDCEKLAKSIEKDAQGGSSTFQWNVVPMTEIDLCNFYEKEEHDAYYKLQAEQKELFEPNEFDNPMTNPEGH
mgnify:CR=1 FL=1